MLMGYTLAKLQLILNNFFYSKHSLLSSGCASSFLMYSSICEFMKQASLCVRAHFGWNCSYRKTCVSSTSGSDSNGLPQRPAGRLFWSQTTRGQWQSAAEVSIQHGWLGKAGVDSIFSSHLLM